MEIGGRLKSVRVKDLGLSSTRVAASYLARLSESERPKNASHSMLAKYERGSTTVCVDLLLVYAAKAGVRPEWILTGEEPRYAKLDPGSPFAGSLAAAVEMEIGRIKESGWEVRLDLARFAEGYGQVFRRHWPIAELRNLDALRDRLLKEFGYEEKHDTADVRAWSPDLPTRIVREPMPEQMKRLIMESSQAEREEFRKMGLRVDKVLQEMEAGKKQDPPPTTPSVAEIEEDVEEESDRHDGG